MPHSETTEWMCIPCAIHRHKISIRPRDERKTPRQST
jgi:ribosomal protein S26